MIINYDPFPFFRTPLSAWYLPQEVYVKSEVKESRAVRRLKKRLNKSK